MSTRSTRKEAVRKPVSNEIQRAGSKRPVDPMLLTGKAFDGDEGLHPDATLADMIRLMFETDNRRYEVDPVNDFLSDVMLCAADDAELIQLAEYAGDGMSSDAIQRVLLRSQWRTTIALELAQRMREAATAVASEAKLEAAE